MENKCCLCGFKQDLFKSEATGTRYCIDCLRTLINDVKGEAEEHLI